MRDGKEADTLPVLGQLGREVRDLSNLAGLDLDDWQCWVMEQACEVRGQTFFNPYTGRREHKWAAFEVGIVVSRQNGKGSLLEARELGGLFLFGERLIIHSAHQADTSFEAFERILMLIENTPELDSEVFRVSRSHGQEGIDLKTGQRLRFRTRTKGGGRGFTGDCLIMDEAMILDSTQVGALMPTLSARPNSQIWYTGSAGWKESTQFGRVRARAIKGEGRRLFFCEWSINPHNDFCIPGCQDHDDEKSVSSYAIANPGLGIRISVEHVQVEQQSMDPEEFRRERLGVGDWPLEGDEWAVISEEAWSKAVDQHSGIEGGFVLAIDVSPDKRYACISAAGVNDDGVNHVEITGDGETYDHRPGVGWVIDALKAIMKQAKPLAVVIDKAGFAGAFEDELTKDLGLKVLTPSTREVAQACGDFRSSVEPRAGESRTLVHLSQIPLTRAVAGATRRDLADMWAWSKRTSSVDITPLVSSTLALWGYRKLSRNPGPEPSIAFL